MTNLVRVRVAAAAGLLLGAGNAMAAPSQPAAKAAAAPAKPAAKPAATQDEADGVVAALRYGQYYDAISKLALAQAQERLQERGLSGAALTAAMDKVQADTAGYRHIFMDQLAAAYRSRFTPAELTQIKTFYGSATGQKFATMKKPIDDELARATRDAGTFVGVSAAKFVP